MFRAYANMLKNIFNFKDRIRRRDFCFAYLLTIIMSFIMSFVLVADSTLAFSGGNGILDLLSRNMSVVLVGLYHTVAWLSMCVRRLHDVGRSGWWVLLVFIPFVNFLLVIFLCTYPSQEHENKYGPYWKDLEDAKMNAEGEEMRGSDADTNEKVERAEKA